MGSQKKKNCAVGIDAVHCVNRCRYDWLDEEADRPIEEQAKVRWESLL